MSMFNELYQLALGATLTMTISADEKQGKLTINVIPKPKTDAGEAALSTPLTLTATPDEFDADFVSALGGFRAAHTSLAQQAQVTQEILDAAKKASAAKGTGAVAKASARTPAAATPKPRSAVQDDGTDADTDGDADDAASSSAAPAPAPTGAGAPHGDEPQLFG